MVALPRSPVFDWSNLRAGMPAPRTGAPPSIDDTRHRMQTSSGRAALVQAMRQLRLEPGSTVLVPSYHCPSIVASMVCAGLQPRFYGIGPDGSPDLAGIATDSPDRPRAMVVVHYFGLPSSLRGVRDWCDANGVALVEDCAHSFFGVAGERTVGQWGDYATASTSKFFPVPEGGLLVSQAHPLRPADLKTPSWRTQLKGWVDVLETSYLHGRVRGIRAALAAFVAAKRRWRPTPSPARPVSSPEAGPRSAQEHDSDLGRVHEHPLFVSRLLVRVLDRQRIVVRRRENYSRYASKLRAVPGARALHPSLPDWAAPYVFPLWVDDADRVYHSMRALGMPVLRWDRVWPGAPTIANDCAPQWRRHVLQLLCHQDLELHDVDLVCSRLSELLAIRATLSPVPEQAAA